MLKYNLCLVQQGSRILLLNREYPSWMGSWNGVGGKLDDGETPRESMIRELREETGLETESLRFKGIITWTLNDAKFGGMYVYLARIPESQRYETPIKTDEGILDWKDIEWMLHPENRGIASNIPPCLRLIVDDDGCYLHHSSFADGGMTSQHSYPISPAMETDEFARNTYLYEFMERQGYSLATPTPQR